MDIVFSSASHHALLFAFTAREAIRVYGAAGSEAITDAVKRYGLQRGRRMAMRARIDCNPINAMTYEMYSEWACFPGQVECTADVCDGVCRLHYSRCPWYTEWKHFDLLPYGKLYCAHIDDAILEGFGLHEGRLTSSRIDHHQYCELEFHDPVYTEENNAFYAAEREKLGTKAIMPWEYHVGHLFACLKYSLVQRFGAGSEQIIEKALKDYSTQFGEGALRLIPEWADLDFNELPAYKSYRIEEIDQISNKTDER